MVRLLARGLLFGLFLPWSCSVFAQRPPADFPSPLDPARTVQPLRHTPLPEEYIWTAESATLHRTADPYSHTQPHLFRATFRVGKFPARATLYLAGPREALVFLNGHRVAHFASDPDAAINFHVFHLDAAKFLQPGENQITVAAIRGRGVITADSSEKTRQLAYGEVLAAKLVGASFGQDGPTLLRSDGQWRSALATAAVDMQAGATPAWAGPPFDDSAWKPVASLGGIESSRDFFQWSADAGMYGWPGYEGISAPLGTFTVAPVMVTHVFAGQARFEHLDALTQTQSAQTFSIVTPDQASVLSDAEAPSLLLDFGREMAGRLLVDSGSDGNAVISIAYGESELEALATGLSSGQRAGNYLGTNLLEIPAHGAARGPKSAFRYVRIRFLHGDPTLALRSIRAEGIAYPVQYVGSFESSDPLLNRIWETGAYTVHLCMQDDLWDAPKRDRGRWAGDIDIEGRAIAAAFGDKALIERTLATLVPAADAQPVNGIPNYSALWITSMASLYAHSGDIDYLRAEHEGLLRVLASMDASLGSDGLYVHGKKDWPFVDWSPGLFGDSPETLVGTTLQFLRGYIAAAQLLDTLADSEHAAHARATAARLKSTLAAKLGSGALPGFGSNWQLNALAIQSGFADSAAAREQSWSGALAHVKQDSPEDPVISPYFNANVLDAMADLGHSREALDWLRTYWGGMLAEGATSFWESYDLRWPKNNPHLSLQADGTTGFFVSMAHGWSAGPTAWLSEQVLGVRDPVDGFRKVTIAPRLLGLEWARGTIPTPHGPIAVSVRREDALEHIEVDLPTGVEEAHLNLQPSQPGTSVVLDGQPVSPTSNDPQRSTLATLRPGHHKITFTPAAP